MGVQNIVTQPYRKPISNNKMTIEDHKLAIRNTFKQAGLHNANLTASLETTLYTLLVGSNKKPLPKGIYYISTCRQCGIKCDKRMKEFFDELKRIQSKLDKGDKEGLVMLHGMWTSLDFLKMLSPSQKETRNFIDAKEYEQNLLKYAKLAGYTPNKKPQIAVNVGKYESDERKSIIRMLEKYKNILKNY